MVSLSTIVPGEHSTNERCNCHDHWFVNIIIIIIIIINLPLSFASIWRMHTDQKRLLQKQSVDCIATVIMQFACKLINRLSRFHNVLNFKYKKK